MAAKKKSKKKVYHSNLAGPYKGKKKAKKARKKSSKKRAKKPKCPPRQANVKAKDILGRSKRKGRRWLCGGPVRSGCGGSNSKVLR